MMIQILTTVRDDEQKIAAVTEEMPQGYPGLYDRELEKACEYL